MKTTILSLVFRGVAMTAVLAAVAIAASCIATDSYVYTAQKYDPANDCVTAYKAIEVVNGSGASATCAPACLTVGEDLYVSTLCPPLPTIATAVAADAGPCIAARAAAATGGTCDAPAPAEGGTDEGGAEAGDEDAGDTDANGVDADGVDATEAGGSKDAGDAG